MINYFLGLAGTWLLVDGLISIRLYLHTLDETGKRLQSWKYDHSIRILRCLIGIGIIIVGGLEYL